MAAPLDDPYPVTSSIAHSVGDPSARALLAALDKPVLVLDEGYRVRLTNERAAELFGADRLVVDTPLAGVLGEPAAGPMPTGERSRECLLKADARGRRRRLRLSFAPLEDEGKGTGWVVTIRDVTIDTPEASRLLLMEACVLHSTDAIVITEARPIDGEGPRITFVNEAFERISGWKSADIIGRTPRVLQGPLTDRAALGRIRDALTNWKPIAEELLNYTKDGVPFWVDLRIKPIRAGGQWFTHWVAVQTDITERRRTEEALRRSETHHRRLIAAAPDGMLELGPEGRVAFANDRAREAFGLGAGERLEGTAWAALWPDDAAGVMADVLASAREGRESRGQLCAAGRLRGPPRWFDVTVVPTGDAAGGFVASVRDITALKLAEEERRSFTDNLLRTQKLESLGVLAGGIAHDFNNLLTGIIGFASLARSTAVNATQADHLARIADAGERAADLCRQLLAYAGKGRYVVEPVRLDSVLLDAAKLLRLTTSNRAELTVRLDPALPPVLADAGQIRQVLVNLVANASEAMGDEDGLVAVSCGVEDVRAGDPRFYLETPSRDGTFVYFEVADTAGGIEETVFARMFEPFFTTRFQGRGLGLPAVLGIARSHDGLLRVSTRRGIGTTIRVYLPASPAAPPPETRRFALGTKFAGTALVIDDDPAVCAVAAEMLRTIGFTVVAATDGRKGLALAREHLAGLRCVLLDMSMPWLDGEQTFRLLREFCAAPVVLMSGYGENELGRRFAGRGISAFLQKPFGVATLTEKVGSALGL